jgi:fatty acid desaturase
MASNSRGSGNDSKPLGSPRPWKSKRPTLKHIEDLRQIGFTGLFFVVFLFAWLSYRSPLSGGLTSVLVWLSLFQLSFMGAVATHNAIHTPLFWSSRLNSLYQVCLSLQYGFPVSVFIPGHNLSHHKYPQQARDFSKPITAAF